MLIHQGKKYSLAVLAALAALAVLAVLAVELKFEGETNRVRLTLWPAQYPQTLLIG